MLSPTILPRLDVQVAQWATVCHCHRFGWNALFPFHMGLVLLLMHRFLASWTPLVIFAVFALSNLMTRVCTNLDCLLAFLAYHEHGTGIEQVHVSVVLILEFFIKTTTEFAHIFLVIDFFLGRNFDELILSFFELFPRLFDGYLLGSFLSLCRQNLLLVISVIPASHLLEFILNTFDYLRPEVFQEGLHTSKSNLIGNSTN